jgi:hypothetical protein
MCWGACWVSTQPLLLLLLLLAARPLLLRL